MHAILGIDAAWTPGQPSGVALIEGRGTSWDVVCAAPSYDAFLACAEGRHFGWNAPRFGGSAPAVGALLDAARRMASTELRVVAVDMPLSSVAFSSRRPADSAISRAFGGRGCSTHSPTAARPGPLGASLMAGLEAEGFALATARPRPKEDPCSIEVYPHPALLALLSRPRRVPYKVARAGRYWPGTSVAERISRLLREFEAIRTALGQWIQGIDLPLPAAGEATTLSGLKRFEDTLDALVCAWVGARFSEGAASAYGDETAAIWVPDEGDPR